MILTIAATTAIAALLIAVLAWLSCISRQRRSLDEPVDVTMHPSILNQSLVARMPSLASYECSWMLRGVHGSTLFGVLLQRAPACTYTQHDLVPLPDGGVIALDWFTAPPSPTVSDARPVLLIIPGTRGHKDSVYVRSAVHAAASRGMIVAVAALRGCGVTALATPRCFDGATHTDIAAVVSHVRAHMSTSQALYAMGFSMGGGMLAHHLCVAGDAARVDAAVVISATTDYVAALKHMSRTYSRLITLSVKSALCSHWRMLRSVPRVSLLRGLLATTIAEWHDAITCPLQGAVDSADFCSRVSFAGQLVHARVPLLCVHARNDPVCPHWTMPEEVCAVNPHVIMAKTDVGGHTGFPQGDTPWTRLTWDVQVAMEYFAAVREVLPAKDGVALSDVAPRSFPTRTSRRRFRRASAAEALAR